MKKTLLGKWEFCEEGGKFLPATVPGCQFLDLLANKIIPDPFVGDNEQAVQWVHDKDYRYSKDFAVSQQELQADEIALVCTRLDTICTLYINGKRFATADNCHRRYRFDVKPWLQEGDNRLEILFHSPKRYVEERYKAHRTPQNANGQNGIVYIRKPQCHFGWDWGPTLIPVGVGGDVYLEFVNGGRPQDPVVSVGKESDAFVVDVFAPLAKAILLVDPDGKTTRHEGERTRFVLDAPRLWWTKELSKEEGDQPLYTVRAVFATAEGEECRDKKIGLRTIELDRSKDQYGYNFRFVLNGVPLFVKGANYIPPDSFVTRFDQDKRKALLDAVQDANLNMIRIWGGGYYADDELLAECDRRGILVWQDCMFACQAYPFFDQVFLDNVLAEIDDNARRISSHPSLALWCGNNEIEAMHLAWATMPQYVEWTEKFFYHILSEALGKIDNKTPYIPGSPCGSAHNKDLDADWVGDTHLWGVWHGLCPATYYRRRYTRFCSEFGFESLPSFETVQSYAKPNEYALTSKVQRAHQKCKGGNDKMLYYIAKRFALSRDIQDLIYLSQVTQQTCVTDAIEHWRRHKGRCNGAIWWQLNDCWQTCSWSSLDYLGNYKALHYAAKACNAPLSVSIEDEGKRVKIYLLNDYDREQSVQIEYFVFDFAHTYPAKARQNVQVEALQNLLVWNIDVSELNPKQNGIAVRLWQDGQCLMQKTLLFKPEKKLRLPQGEIALAESVQDGVRTITLCSPVYQRLVMLSNGGKPFSDNFFDLLPNEPKQVTQPLSSHDGTLAVKTVSTLSRAPLWHTLCAKIKVFLSPRNIANALYHSRIPKENE